MEDNMADASASEETAPTVDLGEAAISEAPEQVDDGSPALPEKFTVKVGGEEMQVSLEEALQGYQRQADYTQKTQALASEREQLEPAQRLWQAIETNPEQTIQAIAEAYGFKLSAAEAAQIAQQQAEPDVEADPEEKRWTQVEQFMQDAQMRDVQAQIDREIVGLHERYGKFDDNALLQYAVDNQIPNLNAAFRSFAFDRIEKTASDKRVQAKKEAAPPIAGGHGVAGGSVTPGSATSTPSIRDAFIAAEAAHGLG